MYEDGFKFACDQLGLTKEARAPLREWFLRTLRGPYGELATRIPVQAIMGGLGGAAAGELHSGHPGSGAALGTLSGGLGGLAVAGAPKLRKRIIEALVRKR